MVCHRALVASVLVAGLVAACSTSAAPPKPPPPTASPSAAGAQASPAVRSRCTLAETDGLQAMTIQAPGPLGQMERTYELHVPGGTGARSPVPLLVSLHGLGANGAIQNSMTGWSAFADAQAQAGAPFIVALPDGQSSTWLWGLESYDVAFVFDVIANLRSSGCVDDTAIYVDGWSAGSYMAQRIACVGSGQGVTLAAVHGYAGGDPALPVPCKPSGTIPVMLSNGLDDQLIDARRLGFPAFEAWGRRYSCNPPGAPYTAAQHLDGCTGGTAVAWWPLQGLGHLNWSCPQDRFWHNRGIWDFLRHRTAPTDSVCR
jgi:polyhydroxybutyrate depolymerase